MKAINKEDRVMDTKILTPKELSETLKIGRDKAYALIKSPTFPSIRIGNRYIVTEQALTSWLINNQYKQVIV